MDSISDLSLLLQRLAAEIFIDMDSRLALIYVPMTILLGYTVYLRRRPAAGATFWRYMFPPEAYANDSLLTDLKLLLLGAFLRVIGLMSFTGLLALSAVTMMEGFASVTGIERAAIEWTFGRYVVLTLVVALVMDFCTYWVHRIHHNMPLLWPLHKVHHSAEVLTPVTIYRKHPLYDAIGGLSKSIVIGALQGVLVFLLAGPIDIWTIGGVNAVLVIFNFLGSNLRHSHVWWNFGPVMSRILISPAQHQIHHSRDKRHYDMNYGEMFAIWDWMFGTLYIPKDDEQIEFGLSNEDGTRLVQPHGNLRDALVVPLQEIAAELRRMSLRTIP